MLRQFLTAAGVMLAMCPIAAPAQDTPNQNTPNPVSTGFRVEALIGYDEAAFDSVFRGDGLLYGIGVGYDLAAGRMRFGVEAEATDSTARTCFGLVGFAGESCLRASRDLYAGVRVGVEIEPGVLLYGKAGYTNFRESNVFPPSLFGGGVTHPNFDGFRLGAGTEIAVGTRTFVKAEYRFSNYEGSQDFNRHQAVFGFGLRF